ENQNVLLKQREKELQWRNDQLDAAFNNMSQGLAMYDASKRLIVCNQLFCELYRVNAQQLRPGTTIRELFGLLVANGLATAEENRSFFGSWRDSAAATAMRLQKLSDGRVLSVSTTQMANAGRVILIEDVTEREHLRAQLSERNAQLNAALNNMAQGLAMLDREGRIVIANTR